MVQTKFFYNHLLALTFPHFVVILLRQNSEVKPCPHCETVAEKCDCRRKRRDNGEIRRLSHFFATVSLF